MQEQRKHTRVRIRSMDVKCKMHFGTEVKLLNMSLSGACISLNKPLEMGSEYTIHIDCADKSLTVKGVVVWERISGSQKNEKGEVLPRYEVGFNIEDVFTEKGVNLIHFIEENIAQKPSKIRLKGLRAKVINTEITSRVEDHRSFKIVKISEGGILLETDKKLELDSRMPMEITLPGETETIKFLGRVASSQSIPGKISELYGTGIEFIDMDERDRSRLKRFITSICSY